MTKINQIMCWCLLMLIVSVLNLSAFNTNTSSILREPQQIKYRPLGGVEEKEEKVYPAGSNAVGSPGTSGTAGSLSAGFGMAYVTIKNSDLEVFMAPFSLTYGINKTNDISFTLPITYNKIPSEKDTKGFGDVSLNLNNNYLNQDDFGFGLGFGLGLTFPTGKKDIVGANNELDINVSVKAEKKIGSNSFNASLGYTYNDCGDFSKRDYSKFSYGIAYSRGINDKFSCSIELSAPDIAASDNEFTQLLFLGGRYSVSNKVSATLLWGKNIGDTLLKQLVITSLSYSF